jgi:hypothetical protein
MITSPNVSPSSNDLMSPSTQRTFGIPTLFSRATSSIAVERSIPTTLTPSYASRMATRPVPQATSSTALPFDLASAANSR